VGQDKVGKVHKAGGGKAVDKGQHQGQNQGLSVHQPLLQKGFWRSYRSRLRTLYVFVSEKTLVKKFSGGLFALNTWKRQPLEQRPDVV
jgi:hypothetical protein